jgi:glyoxylase-like metal-dependent hydrolase (beta-lactamase superfamily II)
MLRDMTHRHSPGSPVTRRTFLTQFGRTSLAVAFLGVAAACSSDSEATTAAAASTGDTAATDAPATTAATAITEETAPETTVAATGSARWERVNLGFVSAYVLERGGEGVIVDTGVEGSESQIEEILVLLDLDWDDVGHVILTHLHPDHIGSLEAVMENAVSAAGYAGEADISGIASPRALTAVSDGDGVFDLEIIHTPGHTPGSISVLEPAGGLLLAGDALNGEGGGVVGANPQFSSDMTAADESVRKLAGLTFDAVVFGHGDPVVGGADAQVAALAAEL